MNEPKEFRETPRNIISKSGTMNLMSDKPFWWVPLSMFFIVLGIVVGILVGNLFRLLGLFVGIILALPAEFFFISARTGKMCRYEADDEKMTVYRKKTTEEYYYREITGVEFKPFYILIFATEPFFCGYKVTIHTKIKDTVRYYAFGGSHGKNPPQETPFWILVMNMPEKKEKDREIVSGEEYYANEKKEEP